MAIACSLTGHSNTITDVTFSDSPTSLHSSAADGTVRGWDLRSNQCTESFSERQELFSFYILDHLIVAGGKGEVIFWDRRSPSHPVLKLTDTHLDDVTQVKLHPSQHVVSASGDGLIAVHDVSRGLVEDDDSFTAALNVGTSVEEVGFYGPQNEQLWVRTGTESLHLWEWKEATCVDRDGGHEAFAEWPEARTAAKAMAQQSSVASLFEEVGYLLGCHYDSVSDGLLLMAGCEGSVGFFPILQQQSGAVILSGQQQHKNRAVTMHTPVLALHGHHTEVIRSIQCAAGSVGQAGTIYASGGEDGLVCLWSADQIDRDQQLLPSSSHDTNVVERGLPRIGGHHQHGGQSTSDHNHVGRSLEQNHGPMKRRTNMGGKKFRKQTPY
ncbi:hypothetical protein CEUSTIGMA_g2840.t1 [Chlamydomonas eustigma]|uniref:Uncharacterized protein n=1 Tax=Chlamydomonas eustigma TaxID=1157962 RepID=A0A250WX89_9CHLO|nr:hypothetical protein CEUSTIGMA_g2840.t1 [Chlamydomonas eustigma]|eukprot:GAX75396.1 hypothetical protein CEUSTIGMA_g2840.t1 [Chlamydomonas eustigma]